MIKTLTLLSALGIMALGAPTAHRKPLTVVAQGATIPDEPKADVNLMWTSSPAGT
jgi:hypothetical protein